jgi:hypothetical protein
MAAYGPAWWRKSIPILRTAVLVGILCLAFGSVVAAGPDSDAYRLKFDPPTLDPLNTIFPRASVAYRSTGCGREAQFIQLVTDKSANEDTLAIVLAKLLVYTQWPLHAARIAGSDAFLCLGVESYRPKEPLPSNYVATLNQTIEGRFGSQCANVLQAVIERPGGPDAAFPDGFVERRYALTRECLRKQINETLFQIEVHGTIGSTGLPCWPPVGGMFKTDGEWHIRVRDLTHVYFVNEQTGRSALDEQTRLKIRNKLLTIDGAPGPEGYNIGQCGNQEQSTGTPEERAEEDDWLDNALDDVGDALNWLKNWLLRLGTLAVAASLLPLFGPLAVAAGSTLIAAGAIAFTFGSIPETENHRLMIESDRYLNNQIILTEIDPADSHRHNFVRDQKEVREWLLKRLQRIAKEEFVEYNARPYQRYSLYAIRLLYNYADNQEIVTAAQNVLDLASAKMAIGSNQGRRLVPYRRLMEALPSYIESSAKFHNGLMDLSSGSDHQIAMMLLYAGMTDQAPNSGVSYGAAMEITPIAPSRYRPPASVVNLAVDKSRAYQQRFKHDGVEIYSSAKGFLLTAGGVRSGPSSTFELAGISPGGSILGIIPLSNNKDRGAAVPTTLMLTAGSHRSSLEAFLHVAGDREALDSDNATYDHNLCVWRGFACGNNVRAPSDMCFVAGPPGTPSQWTFFDSRSSACDVYQNGPQVMIARYVECYEGDSGNRSGDCSVNNVGFFEAVSEPGVTFEAFRQKIVQNNPASPGWLRLIGGLGASDRALLSGTYKSFSGELIEFNTSGHQLDSDETGIRSINGAGERKLSNWPRAAGDLMSGDRDSGKFEFRNPATGTGFRIDMSRWDAPSRQDF